MRKLLSGSFLAVVALSPTLAFAHPGHSEAAGFLHGFLHPVGGLDHILAMLTIGILAYRLGGRALWLVPATFVLVMAGGGVLGVAGATMPLVEAGIASSIIVLGLIVALGVKIPLAVAMGLAGLFAVFHGYAHGTEMPATASAAAYGAGFMLATALLHAGGIALGMLVGRISRRHGQLGYRLAGSAVAIAGVVILTRAVV